MTWQQIIWGKELGGYLAMSIYGEMMWEGTKQWDIGEVISRALGNLHLRREHKGE